MRRSQPLTLLQSFDQPVMETNCTRRGVSTIASQALNLLNSDVMTKQARAFAQRIENEAASDPTAYAYRLALGHAPLTAIEVAMRNFMAAQTDRHARSLAGPKREPTAGEHQQARRAALADLCQMLMSSNEFAYVE